VISNSHVISTKTKFHRLSCKDFIYENGVGQSGIVWTQNWPDTKPVFIIKEYGRCRKPSQFWKWQKIPVLFSLKSSRLIWPEKVFLKCEDNRKTNIFTLYKMYDKIWIFYCDLMFSHSVNIALKTHKRHGPWPFLLRSWCFLWIFLS